MTHPARSCSCALLLALSSLAAHGGELAPPLLAPVSAAKPPETVAGLLFGEKNLWDKTYLEWEEWKKTHYFPFSVGAQNWWHVDRDEKIYGDGYGVPGSRGTYYWFVNFDPSYTFAETSPVDKIGIHFQGRIRDDHDRLRAWYSQNYWSYEMYAYVATDWGTFKGGQIVKEFGIPWDRSWWEGTAYFDGFKFDPDYGVQWVKDLKFNDRFSMYTSVQYFFKEDGVNGSIGGADPESFVGLTEQNTTVLRFMPTFTLAKDLSLTVGASGQFGEIDGNEKFLGVDDYYGAWGADLTLTYKNATLFGEVIRAYGANSPNRYVSGGPSDLVTTYRVGAAYNWGPFTLRSAYSRADELHPSGHQNIFTAGVNTQLTKNITLYTEYVKWNVTNSLGVTSKFDDGFELVVAWSL